MGGESGVRVNLTITGTPSGVETVEMKPVDGASIYDLAGNATLGTQTTGVKALYDKVGPKVTAGSVAADNAYIDVTFNEGVYSDLWGERGAGRVRLRVDLHPERGDGDGGGHRGSCEDDGWGAHGG